jgi:hypothetical protein
VALALLTFKEIGARPIICKLTRPTVARIGAMTYLPIILSDLFTEEGVAGRAISTPFLPKAMKYLIPRHSILGRCSKAGVPRRSISTKRPVSLISSAIRACR